jgi:hypothetical protein
MRIQAALKKLEFSSSMRTRAVEWCQADEEEKAIT